MRGGLKRKLSQVDEDASSSSSPLSSPSSPAMSEWESDGESNSTQSPDFTPSSPASPDTLPIRSILKRPHAAGAQQGSVSFGLVTAFHFPRCQGFTSVPSRGGATLGMVRRHRALYSYTLAEHALEQQRRRREMLRERRREEKLLALRLHLVASGALDHTDAERLAVDHIPDEDLDVCVSDAELEDGGFLQPFSSKRRQALLRAAGVKRVDKEEKRQLHSLRVSRENCGCDCQGFCDPETCACSLAGIKCQMDRFNFPCGCSQDGCGNPEGRVEFSPRRAQAHYIHTLTRIELEGRLQQNALNQRGGPEDDCEPQASPPPDGGRPSPFEATAEGHSAPLAAPPSPSPPTAFRAIPAPLAMEENSCSSDMTDSSWSSARPEESEGVAAAAGGPGCDNLFYGDEEGSTNLLSNSDADDDNSMGSGMTQLISNRGLHGEAREASEATRPLCTSSTADPSSRASVADYLDENANQASDFIQDFPNTPSPSIDYSSSSYMDLSLSSDSDLEFFDSDYASGPLHNSFKGHTHPDNFHHLQVLSSPSLPQYNESSTYLLESLIGLSEP